MNETARVEDGLIVTLAYTLKVDGQVIDSSRESGPIEFIQGVGYIVPGLERELYGMTVGENKLVVVPAEQGYGTVDEAAYMDVPREKFPADIPVEVGTQLEVQDENGQPVYARIAQVDDRLIRLDFNHPLAGRELHFDVQVVAVRAASPEELEHGHVHADEHKPRQRHGKHST